MIKTELFVKSGRPIVILERDGKVDDGAWARLQEAFARGIVGGGENRSDIRADVFFAEIEVLREIRNTFAQIIIFGSSLEAQLRVLGSDRKKRVASVGTKVAQDIHSIAADLKKAGFTRELKDFQLQNLSKILNLPHGADFSVPGAGKTTVGLANYSLNKYRGVVERLLVVAPIAAFEAWREESIACLSVSPKLFIFGGLESVIPKNTEILLTNYNRVASSYDKIRSFVSTRPTQIILDEAHRIKRGADGVHGRAVLDLAYAACRRDVLTGTPAPQGAFDLIALIKFLYPGQDRQIVPSSAYHEKNGREASVLLETRNALAVYFSRTTKTQLGLPGTEFNVVRRPMGKVQQAIYDALIGKFSSTFSSGDSRSEFSRLGRIMMYLLEAATNPLLLPAGSDDDDDYTFEHPPLTFKGDESLMAMLQAYHQHETPWKYIYVADILERAKNNGQKIIVWSNFVRNIKALQKFLARFNPAVIHGGIPNVDATGNVFPNRDSELKKFRYDMSCTVLLANPAACGEGISLHRQCHHAVYLDRTFNAGQFLQSQDRIHRLGLEEGTETQYTLLISEGTIDDSVDDRLREKVTALSELMDDPGLVLVSLPEPDEGDNGAPIYADDLQTVLHHLSIGKKRDAK